MYIFFSSPFFFLVCRSTSEIQRGAFCVWLAPKAVVLQGRLIITEYTTSGKTISTSLMSNMRETKITKKKKQMTRKGLERWSFFLTASLSWQHFLLLLLSTILQSTKNIKEDLKERGASHGGPHLRSGMATILCVDVSEDEKELYIMFHRIWSMCLHAWAHHEMFVCFVQH